MCLLTKNAAFMHIPKTGGSWVTKALENAGLNPKRIVSRYPHEATSNVEGSIHCIPTWDEEFLSKEHKFCFVRHPINWYTSFWAFRMHREFWVMDEPFQANTMAGSFHEFLDNVLKRYPYGYLTYMFGMYTYVATRVGKTENLRNNLVELLDLAGEDYDKEALLATPRQLVTPTKWKKLAIGTKEQVMQLQKQEYKVIDTFGYKVYEP